MQEVVHVQERIPAWCMVTILPGQACEVSRITFPMADSTMQGYWSAKLHTMSATSRMRSAVASEEPPNFITTLICAAMAVVLQVQGWQR